MKRDRKHGGRRTGAGRPSLGPRTSWLIRVPDDVAEEVDEKRGKVSRASLIERLLRKWLKLEK